MKTPIVMTTPLRSSKLQSTEADSQSIVVRHRNVKQGLLARAAAYTSNASSTVKANSPPNHLNDIALANRDPIVWGDASNRYTLKHIEINNNFARDQSEGSLRPSTRNFVSTSPENEQYAKPNWIQTAPMTSSPVVINIENDYAESENALKGILKINESPIIENSIENGFEESKETVNISLSRTDPKRLSFDTTQQLKSGFFRSIKRQYSPLLQPKNDEKPDTPTVSNYSDSDSSSGQSNIENGNPDSDADNKSETRETYSTMSQIAKQKLEQLRKQGPNNVDVSTGLQWIRMELHEMREQDKSLFLQLIKLHSTIKDLRADISGTDEFDSYDDLHSAASLWWPRRGYSSTVLPDFSSSDGAQVFRNGRPKAPLRRGFSLNCPPSGSPIHSATNSINYDVLHSTSDLSTISLLDPDLNSGSVC